MALRRETIGSNGPRASDVSCVATLAALAALLGLIGCDGGGQFAPAPPPSVQPQVTVSFASEAVEVREGENFQIEVRYQVRTLDAPWRLVISPLAQSASADDFELSATSIEIPAAQGVSGDAFLELTAIRDGVFDEGGETLALRFVPDERVAARLGGDLGILIQDGGVSPCPGVSLVATRPVGLEGTDEFHGGAVQRVFTVRSGARESPAMEFVGPYWPAWNPHSENTIFPVHFASWEMETDGDVMQHELEIWVAKGVPRAAKGGWTLDHDLRLAFHGAECGALVATCSSTQCEMNP